MKKILIFILLFLGLTSLSFAALSDNLEAYWTFNNVLTDSTSNGYTLTNSGAVYTASGKLAGAYDFETADPDYMTRSNFTTLASATKASMSFWYKPEQTNVLANIEILDNDNAATHRFGIETTGGTKYVVAGNAGASAYGTITTTFTAGNWYHIALVFNGSASTNANKLKVYVNGVSQTITFSGNINTTLSPLLDEINVGYWQSQSTYADGIIDELGLWKNKALTQTEVNELYDAGNGLAYPLTLTNFRLLHYYNLGNLLDSQGNKPLSMYNTPTTTAGKYGNAYTVSGSGTSSAGGNQLNTSILNQDNFRHSQNYCVAYWVNFGTRKSGGYGLFGLSDASKGQFNIADVSGAGANSKKIYHNSTGTVDYTITNDANFHHYVTCKIYASATQSKIISWEDSILKRNETLNAVFNANSIQLNLGAGTASHQYGSDSTHIFDEFSIWNITGSQLFVDTLYAGGTGCFYGQACFNVFGNVPTITSTKTQFGTLTSNSYFNTTTLRFNITTNYATTKRYWLYYYSNSSLVSTALMSPSSSVSSYVNLTLSNTKYNIFFNATNINGTVTSANYTFTIDATAPVITNNLYVYPNGLYNYTINFSKFISITDANTLTLTNISLSNGQKINISKRQTTTLTRNGNLSYTITARDIAGNWNTVSGVLFVDPRLYDRLYSVPLSQFLSNYTAAHYLNGVLLHTFSVSNPTTYLTKRLYSDLGGIGVHNYVFSKFGYMTKNVSFTTNTSYSRNVTTNMLYSNINVRVYDALTKVLVNKNMTLKVYGAEGEFAKQYRFATGTQTLNEFRSLPGTFRLELIGDGTTYDDSVSINQYVTYLGLENLTVNFYLYRVNDVGDGGLSNIKVFEFKSISSDSKSYLSNIKIDIYKKDIVSNLTTYILYDQKVTSIDGSFNTILSSNDYYKYILTDLDTGVIQPEYLDQPLTSLTTEIEWRKTVLNYNVSLVLDFNNIDYYYDFSDFYYDDYMNGSMTQNQLINAKNPASINISFYFDDILDLMDMGCLNVSYRLTNGALQHINTSCVYAPQGIAVVHVYGRDLYRYPLVFYGYVYNNQTDTLYKMETITLNLNIYNDKENIWGQGLVTANTIGVILALVFLFFGLAMHPVIGIMMYAFIMILLPFTGIAYKPIGAIGLIGIILAILFSYIGKKKRTQQGDP
jgi:hypothetical protein